MHSDQSPSSAEMTDFIWPVRVYYEDTDSGGVIYHANYLRFMERARTEWLRALGFEQDELARRGVLFAVRSVHVDFIQPGRFNQLLEVSARVLRQGNASVFSRSPSWRAATLQRTC